MEREVDVLAGSPPPPSERADHRVAVGHSGRFHGGAVLRAIHLPGVALAGPSRGGMAIGFVGSGIGLGIFVAASALSLGGAVCAWRLGVVTTATLPVEQGVRS